MELEIRDMTVRFGPHVAVDSLSLAIRSGEVHAVVGENGAGKTTAMNAIFGLVQPSAGELRIDAAPQRWMGPQEAIRRGIGMVHQHFMLYEAMTVLENIVLCNEPLGRLKLVDFRKARGRLKAIADEYGIALDADATVGSLSVAERQIVEILKVLFLQADLLIFDEPTAALTPLEKDRLFKVLRGFRERGKAIVLITHKLDEVMELADRVTVMRAGKLISSAPIAETTKDALARDIVGYDLPAAQPRSRTMPGDIALSVQRLEVGGRAARVGPISFDVRCGEIVGIAAVSGNGQSELVQALVGLKQTEAGEVRIMNRPMNGKPIDERRAAGMSYIPEDRQRVGLALDATVAENASIGRMAEPEFHTGPFKRRSAMVRFARDLIQRYRIRVAGPLAAANTMSGGNKQKLVVGRELSRATPLVIVENPTWGVDIGAIDFIHGEIIRMRDQGHAILLLSPELDEIMSLSDRILVMFEGRMSDSMPRQDASKEMIGNLMVSEGARVPEAAA